MTSAQLLLAIPCGIALGIFIEFMIRVRTRRAFDRYKARKKRAL